MGHAKQRNLKPWERRKPPGVLAVGLISLISTGCGHGALQPALPDLGGLAHPEQLPELNPEVFASNSPARAWNAPAELRPASRPIEALKESSASLTADDRKLTLAELVNEALEKNPSTRQSWAQAHAAVAAWAEARGLNYPTLEGYTAGGYYDSGADKGVNNFHQRGIAAGVALDWLLLDFGGRRATGEAARQAFFAANWNHDQAIQDVIRDVTLAYYMHLGSRAQVGAAEVNVTDAEINLRAAEAGRKAGATTTADALQANANLAQKRIALETARGAVRRTRGALATAVGWPANTAIEIDDAGERPPLAALEEGVDRLIERARRNRPELAAQWAAIEQKEAELRKAQAAHWPTISASADVNQQAISGTLSDDDLSYFGILSLKVPLFEGFALENAVRRKRHELVAARAAMAEREDSVIEDVWDAHSSYRTAVERFRGSEDLVSSADESHEVALGRYRAGVGNIVELLRAQSTLADARAHLVAARTDVFNSNAALVHAIGTEPVPSDRTVEGTSEPRSDKFAGSFEPEQPLSY